MSYLNHPCGMAGVMSAAPFHELPLQSFVFTGGESMQSHPAKIVRADETDADAIITILSTGFQNDPVSRWLFPDDDARERLHPEFFGPIVQMALGGEIYTTEDRSGTALWLPVTAHHEDQPGLGELYEPILGADYVKRIAAFDERSTANHPDHEDHFYLPFIAVRPQFFDQGIGTALLRDRLAALDSQGLPTYLEAAIAIAQGFTSAWATSGLTGRPTCRVARACIPCGVILPSRRPGPGCPTQAELTLQDR